MKSNLKNWSEIRVVCETNRLMDDIRPWLSPLFRDSRNWPDVAAINELAATMDSDFTWEFINQVRVPRRAKSRGLASLSGYNHLVLEEKKIPIRTDELHDILNALTFMMFPRSKSMLSSRHLAESPLGIKPGQNRTRTQDLLTIFDEGGVIRLTAPRTGHRDLIFGHAVYEHIIAGKSLRAARLDLPAPDEIISSPIQHLTAVADREFAAWLSDLSHCRSPQEFSSLTVP